MNFSKRHCSWIITFLSITIAARESMSIEPATNRLDPPFWQFILREFVFKTISSPRYRDDDLYNKLLSAPFYGDSLLVASKKENALLSRGNVYNMLDGKWILCEEGCTKCELCYQQNDEPIVKWTLRRVRRLNNLGLPKWDLRLTVVPRIGESFHISKHFRRYNDVDVMNEDKARAKGAHVLDSSNEQQAFALENAQEANSWGSNGAERYTNSDWSNEEAYNDHRRDSMRFKRYRLKRRPRLTYHDPDENVNGVKSSAERSQDDMSPRLIVGIDQHGKKHLVHLIPVDSLLEDLDQHNNYATSYRPSYKSENAAKISRTIQQEEDALSYEKLIERILDSFNTHRNFIENFLFSDKLESLNHNEDAIPLYSTYSENGDKKLEERHLEDYHIDDSRQINPYPSDSEYQVEEKGEYFRRYPDITKEVQKPYSEYQDQNTMIEYEPYSMSAKGQQQQQQHQDERSPLADVERKRRNSFTKLMDSTVEHQAPNQNYTLTDASDAEFSINRNFLENSTDQAFADLPLKINQTEA